MYYSKHLQKLLNLFLVQVKSTSAGGLGVKVCFLPEREIVQLGQGHEILTKIFSV